MDPRQVPPELPQANILLREQQQNDGLQPPFSQSVHHGEGGNEVPRFRSSPWDGQLEIRSLSTAQPHTWKHDLTAVSHMFMRQILGLNPFKTSYFALFRPLTDPESRIILILGIVFAIAAGVPLPLIGVIFGKIINNFPPPEDELNSRLVQLIATSVAYFVVTWGWSVCWGVVGERVSRKMRESLVRRALGMHMAYFDTKAPDMTNILTEKTQTIQLGTSEKVGLFIQSISYFVAAFTVGFTLNAKLTAVLLMTVIPSMGLVVFVGTKVISRLSKQAAQLADAAAAVAESAIRGVQVVQAFGVTEQLGRQHITYLRSALRIGTKKAIVGAFMLGGIYFIAYAANALAFWYGNHLRQGDNASAGTVYAVVFLILDASFVVGQFGPFIQTFALAAAAGGSVFAILDAEKDIDVYSQEGTEVLEAHFRESIQFQDVSFVYPARPTVKVLDDVNIHFEAGKVTGVVGSSGSGKSTIAALLLRLYDPVSGRVTIGGDDIRNFNVASLRSHIALVTQTPVLFTGTILDNIRHGLGKTAESLSEDEILDKCKKAAADANCDFLDNLPDGMLTKIGSGHHSQLSGGQKQRITLARALVGKPSLLLLDEYTSAMDAKSEGIVLENLKRCSADSSCTTIIIAHRLATIKNADNILVMKDGALIEEGQHEVLLNLGGAYAGLVQAQQFDKKQLSSSTPSLRNDSGSILKEKKQDSDSSQSTKGLVMPSPPGLKPREKGSIELIRRCLLLSRPELSAIGFGLLASMISGGIIIGEALIFGNLVQLLNDKSGTSHVNSSVTLFCWMFFLLSVIALISHACGKSAFGLVSENLIVRVRDVSFHTILAQDIAWFSKPGHSHHDLMSKLNMDAGHLSGLSGVILGTFFSIATSVIGGIILAHIIAWKIAIVLLSAVPIMLVAGFFRLRILGKAEERHQTAYNAAAALASEACVSIQTVAALGREADVLRLYKQAIQKPYEDSLNFILWGNILLAFSLSVTYFVYALAYWWGAKLVRDGDYGQKDFFIVLPALLFSAQAAGQMFSLAPEISRAKTAAQSVFALHDERPSIITDSASTLPSTSCSERDVEPLSNIPAPKSSVGYLEFQSVSLFYNTRPDVAALRDVSFSIRPGEYVAFVGRSGAGKSSTIHLIERFFDPTSGAVLLDGRDIRRELVQEHRARLALVEQEPDLFPGSVMYNISLGAKPGVDATEDDVVNVAKKCGLHEFIMSLPEGYNTEVGSNGSQLSGGQCQRLAIARALIRDPEILLLDEATSQLDANTEQEVRHAISAASRGRTTIMIAHRLASVQHADRIFVFDAGKVIEVGTHDELVAMGGTYAAMVCAQELG